MADNKLLNKAITISGKEEKLQGGKPVMKVKDGKGLTYTVYKFKQNGSVSVAWEQIQELSVGDTVQIGYVEDLGEYQGKSVTYRTIRNFNKDIGEGVKNYQSHNPAPSAKEARIGQNLASSGPLGRNYEREAYEKCCSLWTAQLVGRGMAMTEINAILRRGDLWDLFQAIKKDGEKRFAKGWAKAEAIFDEELPTINQDDDPAGDHNPFVNDEPPIEAFGEDIPY